MGNPQSAYNWLGGHLLNYLKPPNDLQGQVEIEQIKIFATIAEQINA